MSYRDIDPANDRFPLLRGKRRDGVEALLCGIRQAQARREFDAVVARMASAFKPTWQQRLWRRLRNAARAVMPWR